METLIIIFASILIITGIAGCFLPFLPGPPVSFIGYLLLIFVSGSTITAKSLIIWGLIAIGIAVLDNFLPYLATKKKGASQAGKAGSIIGLIVGFFILGPIGMIILPFFGTLIGEIIDGKEFNNAFNISLANFIGFLTGIIVKLAVSLIITVKFIIELFEIY